MKAKRAVVVVSAAQHSRVHRCWHLLIQTLHCGWRVLHCGRRVLHCGRRRSIEIGMLVHKDLHCWSVLRIFTNQGKVSSNIFVNIKIFLRNLRKYLIIYPLDKNPRIGPLCSGQLWAHACQRSRLLHSPCSGRQPRGTREGRPPLLRRSSFRMECSEFRNCNWQLKTYSHHYDCPVDLMGVFIYQWKVL